MRTLGGTLQQWKADHYMYKLLSAKVKEEGLVMNKLPNKKVTLECDEQEKKIIELMRQLDFGEIRIIIQNGSPFRVEEIKKSIKL